MPVLTLEERARAIGHLEAGTEVKDVCEMFSITRKACYNLMKKFRENGTVSNKKRSGRPRKTTMVEDEEIVNFHLTDRFRSPQETLDTLNQNISTRTVRRRLKERGIHPRRPAFKPKLSDHHKDSRIKWANTHLRWNENQWSNVLFTDESSFSLAGSPGKLFCYRRKNERYIEETTVEYLNRGYGYVNVWGGIIGNRQTPLIRLDRTLNGQSYIEDILQSVVVPFIRDEQQEYNRNVIFQQDNSPVHKSNAVKNYLHEQSVSVLPWPAVSPDMNPIENVWAVLGKKVHKAH